MNSLLLIIIFFSSLSYAQGTSGSGGNDLVPDGAYDAWFTGNGTIRYCIEMSPKFGTELSFAEMQIEQAFLTWQDYIIRKKVNERTYYDGSPALIAIVSAKMERCDGTEDLHFYLGSENEQVTNEKKRYFNPDGLAKRESYDLKTGWGKGFIWIASAGTISKEYESPGSYPVWTSRNKLLQALITHELGHVFGNGHAGGTIMDKQLSARQVTIPGGAQEFVYNTEIDGTRELYSSAVYIGKISPDDQTAREIFKLFIGKYPHGIPHTDFRLIKETGDAKPILRLIDESGTYNVVIKKDNMLDEMFTSSGDQIFGVTMLGGKSREQSYLDSAAITFSVEAAHGEIKLIHVGYNMVGLNLTNSSGFYNGPLQIYYIENGVRKDLFYRN